MGWPTSRTARALAGPPRRPAECHRRGAGLPLKDCENLRFINLANTPVTDAGLAHLKDCKNLTELGLHNNGGDPRTLG